MRILPLFLMICSAVGVVHKNFVQVYSNYFVQTTSEIDIKCITVNVTEDKYFMNITKTGLLHGLEVSPFRSTSYFRIHDDGKYVSDKETLVKRNDDDDNYIIWTGLNNITVYVWAKDFDIFLEKYNQEVLSNLQRLNYTGLYKSPLYSFSSRCLL